MSILSALNPFTFGRKQMAAWNALMASYTFPQLSGAEQHLVLCKARDVVEDQFRQPFEGLLDRSGSIVALNFLVYGLGEEGISPALGNQNWFWIKNPFVECIGAEEVLDSLKQQLEKQFSVKFDIDS